MGRVVELLVAVNALGGILAFIGLRAGARKVLRRKKDEPKEPDVTVPH
jgi:hypothetical protein